MTFVGKVLVVVNVVLTMCIAMFAGGVFAMQSGWRNKYKKANEELVAARQNHRDEVLKKDDAITALSKQLDDAKRDRDRFRGDAQVAQKSADDKQRDLDAKEVQRKQLQQENTLLRSDNQIKLSQVQSQRKAIKQLHVRNDRLDQEITRLEDEKYGLTRERKQMVRKYNDMVNLLVDYTKLFQYYGKEIDLSLVAGRKLKPVPAGGLVTDVLPGGRDRSTLVLISIGSDDGVTKEQHFFVYRLKDKGKYLGKIRITRVSADEAVGILVDDAKAGKIKEGDHVSAKL
ncbi:MAG: hypothetical protein ACE5KM_18585 [Planctomycetaceae bacterium]